MENLVNSVTCAEIVSKELNRSVKREYISRLAKEERIPYHLVEGKKYYKPSEVIAHLPQERITSSINAKREYIDQLHIIEHFQDQGLNISFDRKDRTKKSYQDEAQYNTHLPLIQAPTVESVRKAIDKLDPTDEAYNCLSDEVIQDEIKCNEVNYILLESMWDSISSRLMQKEFEKELNIELDPLSDNQVLFIFYSILDLFPNDDYLADWIMDEVYSKIEE